MTTASRTKSPELSGLETSSSEHLSTTEGSAAPDSGTNDRRILRSLRRIVRAIDLYSRELKTRCGLTVPQLVCLSAIVREKQITAVDLSLQVHLSPSTLVGILDRLEKAHLIDRERNSADRRQIIISATNVGKDAIRKAPSPLQDNLAFGLSTLPASEQTTIAESLEKIVKLMEAHEIKVAPLLTLERRSYAATAATKSRKTGKQTRTDKN